MSKYDVRKKMACSDCPLQGRTRVQPVGEKDATYVLVGEAPGADEARQGLPFVGRSGKILTKFLTARGIDRGDCYITNAVKCWPPHNKLPPGAAAACLPQLLTELRQTDGRLCLMGKSARDALLPALSKKGVLSTRGWHTWEGRDVLCTVHPAYVMYNPNNAPLLLKDLERLKLGKRPPVAVAHIIIDTPDLLRRLIKEVAKREGEFVACDLETNQITYWQDEILLIGIGYAPGRAAMIVPKYQGFPPRVSPLVKDLLQDLFDLPVRWVGHNARFDWRFLEHQLGLRIRWDFDTLLAHYTLDERRGTHGLKGLADEYFDVGDYEQDVLQYMKKKSGNYRDVPLNALARYCAIDVEVTRRLAYIFEVELKRQGLYERPFRFPIMAAVPTLHAMEMTGIAIDWDEVQRIDDKELEPELQRLKGELQSISGHSNLNPLSSKRVNEILYDEMGFPVINVRTRAAGTRIHARSSQVAVLDGWAKMWKQGKLRVTKKAWFFVRTLREYRHLRKMRGSYIRKWQTFRAPDDRVHPSFLIYGTVTGRLSAVDPPVQTIPSKVRDKWGPLVANIHIATPGWKLVYADYSQAELMAAACMSQDPFMLEAFRKGDADYHSEVARAAFGEEFTRDERQSGKKLTFGWLYGGNVKEIALDALQFEGAVAERFAHEWDDLFAGVLVWRRVQQKKMLTQGYVESVFGRRRRFAFLSTENVGKAKRIAVNAPVQSSVSDLTLVSAIRLHEMYKDSGYAHPLLLIHDALILEVREDQAEEVARAMSRVMLEVAAEYFPDVPFRADTKIINKLGEA